MFLIHFFQFFSFYKDIQRLDYIGIFAFFRLKFLHFHLQKNQIMRVHKTFGHIGNFKVVIFRKV